MVVAVVAQYGVPAAAQEQVAVVFPWWSADLRRG